MNSECVFIYSSRIWSVFVWWWPKEGSLAGVGSDPRVLPSEKWGTIQILCSFVEILYSTFGSV